MVKLVLGEDKIEEFKTLSELYTNLNFIAKMILLFPKEISSKTGKKLQEVENILQEYYADILVNLKKKKITEGEVKEIMIKLVNEGNFEEILKEEKADNSGVEEKILNIIKSKPGLNANAYMGLVMAEMKGKINGKEAMEIINKLIDKK